MNHNDLLEKTYERLPEYPQEQIRMVMNDFFSALRYYITKPHIYFLKGIRIKKYFKIYLNKYKIKRKVSNLEADDIKSDYLLYLWETYHNLLNNGEYTQRSKKTKGDHNE